MLVACIMISASVVNLWSLFSECYFTDKTCLYSLLFFSFLMAGGWATKVGLPCWLEESTSLFFWDSTNVSSFPCISWFLLRCYWFFVYLSWKIDWISCVGVLCVISIISYCWKSWWTLFLGLLTNNFSLCMQLTVCTLPILLDNLWHLFVILINDCTSDICVPIRKSMLYFMSSPNSSGDKIWFCALYR